MGDAKRRKGLGFYPEKSGMVRLPVAPRSEAVAILRSLPDKSWFRNHSAMHQLTTRSLSESEIEALSLVFPWEEYLTSCLMYNVKGEALILVLGQIVVSSLDVGQITDQAVVFALNNIRQFFKALGKQAGIV